MSSNLHDFLLKIYDSSHFCSSTDSFVFSLVAFKISSLVSVIGCLCGVMLLYVCVYSDWTSLSSLNLWVYILVTFRKIFTTIQWMLFFFFFVPAPASFWYSSFIFVKLFDVVSQITDFYQSFFPPLASFWINIFKFLIIFSVVSCVPLIIY